MSEQTLREVIRELHVLPSVSINGFVDVEYKNNIAELLYKGKSGLKDFYYKLDGPYAIYTAEKSLKLVHALAALEYFNEDNTICEEFKSKIKRLIHNTLNDETEFLEHYLLEGKKIQYLDEKQMVTTGLLLFIETEFDLLKSKRMGVNQNRQQYFRYILLSKRIRDAQASYNERTTRQR